MRRAGRAQLAFDDRRDLAGMESDVCPERPQIVGDKGGHLFEPLRRSC